MKVEMKVKSNKRKSKNEKKSTKSYLFGTKTSRDTLQR